MKESNYNFFYKDKVGTEKIIAYNSLTSSLALIEEKSYREYLEFCNKGKAIGDHNFIGKMKMGGFLIDENIDELDIIKHDMFQNKFNTTSMTLTIVPTMNCNFRCVYCYEKKAISDCNMTKEIADRTINFIEKNVKFLSSLHISWYGGEPLLETNMINYLSEKAINICIQNNIKYGASIVTNGYFLNENSIEVLKKSMVYSAQVTIDGGEKTHNSRRPLYDGKPSFYKIIDNLETAKNKNFKIVLRINVDKTNYREAFTVVNILKERGLNDNVIPYLGLVRNYNECYKVDKCMDFENFTEINKEFKKYIKKEGFFCNEDTEKLPRRINCYCSAEKANSYLINADGEMYKCWSDIGDLKLSVGNITKGFEKNNITYLNYVMSDPCKDLECRDCKYLPICFSGCPRDRELKAEVKCSLYKPNVEKHIFSILNSHNKL